MPRKKKIIEIANEKKSKKIEIQDRFERLIQLSANAKIKNLSDLKNVFHTAEGLLKEQYLDEYLKFEILFIKLFYQIHIKEHLQTSNELNLEDNFQFELDLIEFIALHEKCKSQIPKKVKHIYKIDVFCRELFRIYKSKGDLLSAEKYLFQIPNEERDGSFKELKVSLLIDQYKYREASEILEEILQTDEGNVKFENYYNMAYTQLALCNYQYAKECLNKAIELNNQSIHVKLLLLNVHILKNEFDEAKKIIDFIPKEEKNHVFYKNLADYHRGLYNDEEEEIARKVSIKKMSISISFEGTIRDIIYSYGSLLHLYMRQGRKDDYKKLYKEVEQKYQQYPLFVFIKLQYMFYMKGSGKCKSTIEEAKKLFPNDSDILKFEIDSRYIQKEYQEVIKLVDEFLEIYPHDMSIFNDLGKSYLALNQLERAKESLLKYYDEFPNKKDIRIDLGNYFMHAKNYNKALEYYLDEVKLFPQQQTNVKLLNNIAAAYYSLENYEECIEFLEQALKLDNFNHNLYIHKGLAFFNKNTPDLVKSKECFLRALFIHPQSFTKLKPYLNKIEADLEAKHNISESESIIEDTIKISLSNFAIQNKKSLSETKFKLYKTETEFEKTKKVMLNTKKPEGKIWGESFPIIGDPAVYPLVWQGSNIEKTKTYGWINKNSKSITSLEDNVLSKSESILEKGKFTAKAKGQQGIKLYEKCAKIKNLGANGAADVRIIGRRIKNKESGYSLYVFDEVQEKHRR